jgi:cytochrome P450
MSEPFLLNPLAPEFQDNPRPFYARARAEAPVMRHGSLPMVSIFRHADVMAVLRDSSAWSVVPPDDSPFAQQMREADREPSMLSSDPPRHTRLRGLVNSVFTPRRVKALEPRLREIATDLLDAALEKGTVDLVRAYTAPLTVVMIAELLGIPREDHERFKAWSNVVAENLGEGIGGTPVDPERAKRRERANEEMVAYFGELADARRAEPRDDLLSGLVAAHFEGESLSRPELDSMLTLLLVAGNETTTNLIGNTVIQLDAHPDQLALLRDDASLVPGAIEEVLRYDSPVQATSRRPLQPVELGTEKVTPSENVLTWVGSANHDEAVFENPEHFDIRREPKAQIMSFGFGIHHCLGHNLARIEAQVALDELLRRTSSFRRADQDPVKRTLGFILRGPQELDVELRAS